MDTQPSPDGSDIPRVVGRRSARLAVIVPVTVRGTDLGGQVFKENTWTISVNRLGGRLATFHNMAAGAPIVIVNPLLGRTAKAQVIRVTGPSQSPTRGHRRRRPSERLHQRLQEQVGQPR
jgi:hypothetical protein